MSIYVNDPPLNVTSPTLMFAGDTKIFRSIQNDTDYIQLHFDIIRVVQNMSTELQCTQMLTFTPWKISLLYPV